MHVCFFPSFLNKRPHTPFQVYLLTRSRKWGWTCAHKGTLEEKSLRDTKSTRQTCINPTSSGYTAWADIWKGVIRERMLWVIFFKVYTRVTAATIKIQSVSVTPRSSFMSLCGWAPPWTHTPVLRSVSFSASVPGPRAAERPALGRASRGISQYRWGLLWAGRPAEHPPTRAHSFNPPTTKRGRSCCHLDFRRDV